MNFLDLKYDCENKKKSEIQNKQHINISTRAKDIIMSDEDVFYVQKNTAENRSMEKKHPSSNMINHIFRNFKDSARASVGNTLTKERDRLNEILHDLNNSQRLIAQNALIENKRKELDVYIDSLKKRKGFSFKINIDSDNIKYLTSDAGQLEKEYYNDKIGGYIEALLEEYAELPYIEREKIFYKSNLETIYAAMNQNKQLSLQVYKNSIVFKPYSICKDPESLYNYLVGLRLIYKYEDDLPEPKKEWQITSIRLSSIQKCSCTTDDAFFSKDIKKQICQNIEKQGVQYLADRGENIKLVVYLDKNGLKDYHKLLHLRPMYVNQLQINEQGGATLEFYCSETQAEYYFFKYGHKAKILEPKYLASKFARKYSNAAKQYSEEC